MGTSLFRRGQQSLRAIGIHVVVGLSAICGVCAGTLPAQPTHPTGKAKTRSAVESRRGPAKTRVAAAVNSPKQKLQGGCWNGFPCGDDEPGQEEVALERVWPSPFPPAPEASEHGDEFGPKADGGERGFGSPLSGGRANLHNALTCDSSTADSAQSPKKPSQKQPSAEQGSPKHIFLVIPAFEVSYQKQFQPLTPREKFDEWIRGTYDPGGLGLYAVEAATLEHSSADGYCGYGKSFGDYGKCFGSMQLDSNISSFFGDFLLPVILHQDPRYFRLGKGSVQVRVWYAISRVFITHTDTGRWTFASAALSGSVIAAAASNLYYPRNDRGFGNSLDRFGIDLADTAAFNVSAEFWPEIKHGLKRVF